MTGINNKLMRAKVYYVMSNVGYLTIGVKMRNHKVEAQIVTGWVITVIKSA